jgi:hypothetical protein
MHDLFSLHMSMIWFGMSIYITLDKQNVLGKMENGMWNKRSILYDQIYLGLWKKTRTTLIDIMLDRSPGGTHQHVYSRLHEARWRLHPLIRWFTTASKTRVNCTKYQVLETYAHFTSCVLTLVASCMSQKKLLHHGPCFSLKIITLH